jgi:hypothetical protein
MISIHFLILKDYNYLLCNCCKELNMCLPNLVQVSQLYGWWLRGADSKLHSTFILGASASKFKLQICAVFKVINGGFINPEIT